MKVPKKIAKTIRKYEETRKKLFELQKEAKTCMQVFTDWEKENINSGVCIYDLHIADKPRGKEEGKGEYREHYQCDGRSFFGTYFLPIKGSDKYIAYDYECVDFDNSENGEEEKFMSGAGEAKETITLELTKCEVLMLQELTEDTEHFYKWQEEIAASLREKALDAYEKPYMDATDYADLVDSTRKLWQGESVQEEMVRAKQHELEFLYDVEDTVWNG